jgi:hypothetical protein
MSEIDTSDYSAFPERSTIPEFQQMFEQKYKSFKRGERARVDELEDGSKTRSNYIAYEIPTSKSETATNFLLDAAQTGYSLWASVHLEKKSDVVFILQRSSGK